MVSVNPDDAFTGKLVIVAPHMDDEALACGGLIARFSRKECIHIIYATDGMKSPAPVMPGDVISSDLGEVRVQESTAAMSFLGIPEDNLHYLQLPENQWKKNMKAAETLLVELIQRIHPDYIFIPFRYDRHPDHVAINHVITESQKQGKYQAQLLEYFVYHRWRLLAKKDIRAYIKPEHLMIIDNTGVSEQKWMALNCYKSQTSRYFAWQTRPILTPQLLEEESQNPEYFLVYDPSLPGAAVFSSTTFWIRVVHRIEPLLKDWKYQIMVLLKRVFGKYVSAAE
jgi:LmbE family N-acetylglucosaminyl deacetylase